MEIFDFIIFVCEGDLLKYLSIRILFIELYLFLLNALYHNVMYQESH